MESNIVSFKTAVKSPSPRIYNRLPEEAQHREKGKLIAELCKELKTISKEELVAKYIQLIINSDYRELYRIYYPES